MEFLAVAGVIAFAISAVTVRTVSYLGKVVDDDGYIDVSDPEKFEPCYNSKESLYSKNPHKVEAYINTCVSCLATNESMALPRYTSCPYCGSDVKHNGTGIYQNGVWYKNIVSIKV